MLRIVEKASILFLLPCSLYRQTFIKHAEKIGKTVRH